MKERLRFSTLTSSPHWQTLMAGRARMGRWVTVVTVLTLLAVSLAWWQQWSWGVFFYLVVGLPFVVAASLMVLVALVVSRLWGRAVLVGLCLLLPVSTQIPWWVSQDAPDWHTIAGQARSELTVMSINMKFGAADAAQIVQAVREHHVQVLCVQELTQQAQQRLEQEGLGRLLPHRFTVPGPTSWGSGMWSVFPLVDEHQWPGFSMANLHAQVEGADRSPLRVVLVHPAAPLDRKLWHGEAKKLHTHLNSLRGPLVVVGDFNATVDQPSMRRLAAAGFLNVVDQVGAGWMPTWGPLVRGPRLAGIDHVLVRGGPWGQDVFTVSVDGSDHRAVVARVDVGSEGISDP